MTTSRIVHIDMDAFFAAVEVVHNPELAGKPLIVGGKKTDLRGVVSTASYEARKFGVRSAMPIAQAAKLCPHGIFIRGQYEHYVAASREVRAVLETVSPLVQFASIDEAYVDVTGSQRLFGGDDAIAAYIKETIRKRTQLSCTVAISSNKLVSKVASAEGKPDGYVRVADGDEAVYFAPLPVGKLPGVGPRLQATLKSMGIVTLGELAAIPEAKLEAHFGAMGRSLQRRARGESKGKVEVNSIPKSMGRETTFSRDLSDWGRIESVLSYLTEKTAYALRERGMEGRCVTLKVRYAGFDTKTFAKTMRVATALDTDLFDALKELLPKARARRDPVRLIGVSVSQLSFDQHQLHLFGREDAEKWEKVLEGVDAVRHRHGFQSLRSARSMELGKEVKLSNPSLSR